MTLDFDIPPGWAPHPEAPGWFYKGEKVKSTEQLREMAMNRAAHDAAQAEKNPGKQPANKITSSQHPKAGDKADPHLLHLIAEAKRAAEEAVPAILAAAVADHLAPPDAPTHGALEKVQIERMTPEYRMRQLAISAMPMAMAQLAVIASDPLQLGATRVSAIAHIMERAGGKPAARLTPIPDDLDAMSGEEAMATLTRIAKSGELSADDVKAYAALIEARTKGAEGRELIERVKALEALLIGAQTVNA